MGQISPVAQKFRETNVESSSVQLLANLNNALLE